MCSLILVSLRTFDNGTYTWNGIDPIDRTIVIPFEMSPQMTLGKMILDKSATNFFVELEATFLAPLIVVKGVTFVLDPLFQWRLMSYDDTANHRHKPPNGYLLPIERAVVPINSDYRDGYMQPEGASTSPPDRIGSVISASLSTTLSGTFSYICTPIRSSMVLYPAT